MTIEYSAYFHSYDSRKIHLEECFANLDRIIKSGHTEKHNRKLLLIISEALKLHNLGSRHSLYRTNMKQQTFNRANRKNRKNRKCIDKRNKLADRIAIIQDNFTLFTVV